MKIVYRFEFVGLELIWRVLYESKTFFLASFECV